MLRKIIILMLLLVSATQAQIQFGDSIMPFGFQSSRIANDYNYYTPGFLHYIKTELGVSQIKTHGFDSTAIDWFADSSIYAYANGTGYFENDLFIRLASCQYFVTQPELSDSFNIAFKSRTASWTLDIANGYAYTSTNDTLTGLGYRHPNLYSDLDYGARIRYHPSMAIKIDTSGFSGDTLVGLFWANNVDAPHTTFIIDSLWYSDFRDSLGNIHTDFIELDLKNELDNNNNYFTLAGQYDTVSIWVKYSFQTYANCMIYIDSLTIHCQQGQRLMNGEYDASIKSSAGNGYYENKILGWFMYDTQNPGNNRPLGYINKLIMDTTSLWDSGPVYAASWVTAKGGLNQWGGTYRDFIKTANPKMLWTHMYPIENLTDYTGFNTGDSSAAWQSALHKRIVLGCDSIRVALTESDSTEGWLLTPQAWFCDTSLGNCPASDPWRPPTGAEMRCMTYVGMCYHPNR